MFTPRPKWAFTRRGREGKKIKTRKTNDRIIIINRNVGSQVLPVAVRSAHRQEVPGERDGPVVARRRRRDVRRVRRVRGRHAGHGVQRTLGAHRQAVPAVRGQLRLHRQTRVAVPRLGLPAQARGRRDRRAVPEGPGQQHVHAAGQVLRRARPQHHTAAVRPVRVRLQAVQLQSAERFGLRGGLTRTTAPHDCRHNRNFPCSKLPFPSPTSPSLLVTAPLN